MHWLRKTAAVVLILAALLNILASMGYLASGFLSALATRPGGETADSLVEGEGVSATPGGDMSATAEGTSFAEVPGPLSALLLLSSFVLIAAGLYLFQGVKPNFVLVAGGVAVLAELVDIVVTGFGPFNLTGIVGGLIAIAVALRLRAFPLPVQVPPAESVSTAAAVSEVKAPYDIQDKLLLGLAVAGAVGLVMIAVWALV